jgi:hypothetical protein
MCVQLLHQCANLQRHDKTITLTNALHTHILLLYSVSCTVQEKHEAERYSIASELLSVKNEACDLELRLQEAQQGKVNRAK